MLISVSPLIMSRYDRARRFTSIGAVISVGLIGPRLFILINELFINVILVNVHYATSLSTSLVKQIRALVPTILLPSCCVTTNASPRTSAVILLKCLGRSGMTTNSALVSVGPDNSRRRNDRVTSLLLSRASVVI